MSTLEKMAAYIKTTKIPKEVTGHYSLRFNEILALAHYRGSVDSVCMAFKFGMAKGYRAGKKAVQK